MPTLVHGIDIVEVQRIAHMRAEHADHFLERCFTYKERTYAAEIPKRMDERLAARFAAKEAVLKALGTGLRHGIAWTDIEVTRDPQGKPGLALSGVAGEVAAKLGVWEWTLTLSHAGGMAVASAIGVIERA